jgi:hypothetical protein
VLLHIKRWKLLALPLHALVARISLLSLQRFKQICVLLRTSSLLRLLVLLSFMLRM